MVDRFTALEGRVTHIEESHNRLSDAVRENNRQTARMYDIFQPVENAFKLLAKIYGACVWIARKLKPLAIIGAIGTALWHLGKTGKWELIWPG